jgi:hypothetical protein
MVEGMVDKARESVVSVIKGAGDVAGSVREVVTDLVTGALRGTGEIRATAMGVVSDTVRGAMKGTREAGTEVA